MRRQTIKTKQEVIIFVEKISVYRKFQSNLIYRRDLFNFIDGVKLEAIYAMKKLDQKNRIREKKEGLSRFVSMT